MLLNKIFYSMFLFETKFDLSKRFSTSNQGENNGNPREGEIQETSKVPVYF